MYCRNLFIVPDETELMQMKTIGGDGNTKVRNEAQILFLFG